MYIDIYIYITLYIIILIIMIVIMIIIYYIQYIHICREQLTDSPAPATTSQLRPLQARARSD